VEPWWKQRPAWLPRGRARWLLFLLVLVVAFLGYDWFRLSALASNRYAGKGWKFPTRVFADWRDFRVGDQVDVSLLREAWNGRGTAASGTVPPMPGSTASGARS